MEMHARNVQHSKKKKKKKDCQTKGHENILNKAFLIETEMSQLSDDAGHLFTSI